MAETVFDVLRREHKEIRQLMRKAARDPRQYSGFSEELNAHVVSEERTLYTPLKSDKSVRDIVLEAFEEHHIVGLIMREIEGEAAGGEEWQAKFKVMSENLEHHIEEEEQTLFPAAEKAIGPKRARELTGRYHSAEAELVGSAGRS